MIRYVIALSELGLSNGDLLYLLADHFSKIRDMFLLPPNEVMESDLALLPYQSLFADRDALKRALLKADAILNKNSALHIKTTFYTDPSYPSSLTLIDHPPAIVYYKGASFQDLPEKAIACVGTRKPSPQAKSAVYKLVPQWVSLGFSIISGLAEGIDAASHKACLDAGGRTVAVLGCGLDTVYPWENAALADRILQKGGILMSNYPVFTGVEKYRLIERNRLITGLSQAVVVFECALKGGSMHSVSFAGKQHKPVFCPPLSFGAMEGTRMLLLKKIASPVFPGDQIL